MNGINLIRQERVRQVMEEGWTASHDAQWENGELVKAAICYALTGSTGVKDTPSLFWPWHPEWYKPRLGDDDLIKAGALIAAELDRRQVSKNGIDFTTVEGEGLLAGVKAVGPKIVCLCGSTRFYEEFQVANYEETMKGNIVLTVGFYAHRAEMIPVHGETVGITPEEKEQLDELHLRKIDMADEVFFINPGGYIGESTGRELIYAAKLGKELRFLEPIAPKPGWSLTPPERELKEGQKWQAYALLEEGWHLNWDILDVDGMPTSEYCPDIEWPFPVNYARIEDFTALGFEIV